MIDIRKLKTLLDLVRESGVGELEITDGDDHIRIVNAVSATTPLAPAMAPINPPPPVAPPQVLAVPSAPTQETTAPNKPEGKAINSPMVGTFYRSSAPGAKPFVNVGDTVKAGQVLCIIEGMKLLNEVEAETDGVIREICVENGQPVEYDQPLFILG